MSDKNGTQAAKVKPNQIETEASVKIPLPVVYAALKQYLDGEAQSASVRGESVLVVQVVKRQEVAA